MASIRKRVDLQWEARIRRKGWPVTCKTFNTKSDAEKWAWDIENEMDKGVSPGTRLSDQRAQAARKVGRQRARSTACVQRSARKLCFPL